MINEASIIRYSHFKSAVKLNNKLNESMVSQYSIRHPNFYLATLQSSKSTQLTTIEFHKTHNMCVHTKYCSVQTVLVAIL